MVDDDHQPMVVNDADEFDKVVSVTWLPPSGEWSIDQLRAQVSFLLLFLDNTQVRDSVIRHTTGADDYCMSFIRAGARASRSRCRSRRRTRFAASTSGPSRNNIISSPKGSQNIIVTLTMSSAKSVLHLLPL